MTVQKMPNTKTIRLENKGGVLTIELSRPDVRNAFNDELITDLQNTFDWLANDPSVRVTVLKGSGPVFCAGGDLNWMQRSVQLSRDENLADTRKLSKMFYTMNLSPKPLVGLVQGAAIGGGVGLVSVCDYVVAEKKTTFSLSEVRLGIVPACIGPFVIAKIGESYARAYFISAERFDAGRAREIGLVHELVDSAAELQIAQDRITQNLLQCGPNAMAVAKSLVRSIKECEPGKVMEHVSCLLADLRVSPEGQEGLKAFLEKRKPNWVRS
ncbi:MAG TPA: enoyl-CoA hydratase-related protein [Oligoflexia bacterium]|nr:enoyl-CoA hydratase-related protein [Oligoflexia bacterium]